jgi:hypothetical protein
VIRPSRRPAAALAFAASLLAAPLARAQDPAGEDGVAVTVYSEPGGDRNQQPIYDPVRNAWVQPAPGFSLVRERRTLDLQEGVTTLRFTDVAARIDPSTVKFRSLTDPAGTSVLEQRFEYDLVSADKLLGKYLDKEISVTLDGAGPQTGRLLSFDAAQLVLEDKGTGAVRIVRRDQNLRGLYLPSLPGGLVTKPTLEWVVKSGRAGSHRVDVAYETAGMSWSADYTAVVAPDEASLDLSAWVTLRNESGVGYPNARLKLVAGDVHRAPQPGMTPAMDEAVALGAKRAGAEAGFEEKSFFEYHMYTLGRRTSIKENSLQQVELFPPASRVPCRKQFLYYGNPGIPHWYGGEPNMDRNWGVVTNAKVDVYLEFENKAAAGLGMPLPAGRVRVNKVDDADGGIELVGEDRIDHTPRDERLRLRLGSAFDIVGERKQSSFDAQYDQRWIREGYSIRLRNAKDTPVEVVVKENLYRWVNWEILKSTVPAEKQDSRTVHFTVKVPARGEAALDYSVRYTW